MDNLWYSDSDVYCEGCAPKDARECVNGNEVDSPQHCSVCHMPLDYSLTSDGVAYVMEALREELGKGYKRYLEVHECYVGTYYEGEPHVSILWDWACDLLWYTLEDDADRRFVDRFLSWTRGQYDKHFKKGETK